MKFKLPAGMTAVSVLGKEYIADDAGIIDVGAEPGEAVVKELGKPHVGATLATEADEEAAGNIQSDKLQKSEVVAELKALGVPFDARASLTYLTNLLAVEKPKKAAAAAAAFAAAASAATTAAAAAG